MTKDLTFISSESGKEREKRFVAVITAEMVVLFLKMKDWKRSSWGRGSWVRNQEF